MKRMGERISHKWKLKFCYHINMLSLKSKVNLWSKLLKRYQFGSGATESSNIGRNILSSTRQKLSK